LETTALVAMARQGDNGAFGALVERYWRLALSTALSQVGNYADAEDIAQDAFITAYSKLALLRDDARFVPWLRAIVANSGRMHARATGANPEVLIGDTQPEPQGRAILAGDVSLETQALERELSREIAAAVSALPSSCREVALLRYVAGLPYREIGDVLGLPGPTVSYRLRRANALMRKGLAHVMEGSGRNSSTTGEGPKIVQRVSGLISEANRLATKGDIGGAEAALSRAAQTASGSPGLHLEVAGRLHALFVQSGFQRALGDRVIGEFNRALALGLEGAVWGDGPVEPWAPHAGMALAYLHLKEYEASRRMLDQAKALGQPYDFNEGSWYSYQGRHEEAITFYRGLQQTHGADDGGKTGEMCRLNIAGILVDLQRYDEALDQYGDLIADGVDTAFCWYWTAIIHARTGAADRCMAALAKAAEGSPMYASWAREQGAFAQYGGLPEFREITGA
jgi:RNA polymerase sigma-70 factor, ECF subfamily